MEKISLIKRLLYYIGLSLLSFLITVVFGGVFRESSLTFFIISVFFIPHYIFGRIFLKTKWFYKLIIPSVTALVSFGGLWWCILPLFDTIENEILYSFLFFIPIAFSWEITYQILIRCLNKNTTSQEL